MSEGEQRKTNVGIVIVGDGNLCGEEQKKELSEAIDALVPRYGRNVVNLGMVMHDAAGIARQMKRLQCPEWLVTAHISLLANCCSTISVALNIDEELASQVATTLTEVAGALLIEVEEAEKKG